MWQPVGQNKTPSDHDLRLAVIEGKEVHELVFPCRYRDGLWFDSATGRQVTVEPTHYQLWQQTEA